MYNLRKYSDKQINNRLKKEHKKIYQIKIFLAVFVVKFCIHYIYTIILANDNHDKQKIFQYFSTFP
jgi:hypothetical protein